MILKIDIINLKKIIIIVLLTSIFLIVFSLIKIKYKKFGCIIKCKN